jgi:hypothetical protein
MEAGTTAWAFRCRPKLRPRGVAREFAQATGAIADGESRRGVPAIFARRTTSRAPFDILLDISCPPAAFAVTPDWRQRRPRVSGRLGPKLRT